MFGISETSSFSSSSFAFWPTHPPRFLRSGYSAGSNSLLLHTSQTRRQLLAPNLIQKHFLPGGVEQFSKQVLLYIYYIKL